MGIFIPTHEGERVDVTFFGVRGSCPCASDANRRYGGNTACVALTVDGEPPVILDLGTGLRSFGETQPADGSFHGTALVTHMHWDHVQGLPFFPPVDRPGASLDVWGPTQIDCSLEDAFGDLMRPPYFPVRPSDLRGEIKFHDALEDSVSVGNATVTIRPVPHVGATVGYRVAWDDATVAYISDHQAPIGLDTVADSVLELADGADILIHDAQYTPKEFGEKSHWGHCTVGYAVEVARRAGVGCLVMFHHDPAHDDDTIDALLAQARASEHAGDPEVIAAAEGLVLHL
jgi:phosphoribosyl 1,2-cyclic phosphodiesterase